MKASKSSKSPGKKSARSARRGNAASTRRTVAPSKLKPDSSPPRKSPPKGNAAAARSKADSMLPTTESSAVAPSFVAESSSSLVVYPVDAPPGTTTLTLATAPRMAVCAPQFNGELHRILEQGLPADYRLPVPVPVPVPSPNELPEQPEKQEQPQVVQQQLAQEQTVQQEQVAEQQQQGRQLQEGAQQQHKESQRVEQRVAEKQQQAPQVESSAGPSKQLSGLDQLREQAEVGEEEKDSDAQQYVALSRTLSDDPRIARPGCSLIVWVDVRKAIQEGVHFFESSDGLLLCRGDADGSLRSRFCSFVMELRGGLALELKSIQLIERLCHGRYSSVVLTRLSGSINGVLTLASKGIDAVSRREVTSLVQVGDCDTISREALALPNTSELMGCEHIQVLEGPLFADSAGAPIAGSDSSASCGALLLGMASPCWTALEFASLTNITTLKQTIQEGIATEESWSDVELSLVCGLWRSNQPLYRLALRTAARAQSAAVERGGLLHSELQKLAEGLVELFVPACPVEGYTTPPVLSELFQRLAQAGHLDMDANRKGDFAQSFARQADPDVWSDMSAFTALIDLLENLAPGDAGVAAQKFSWLAAWHPITVQQHGDLNLDNIVMDTLGSAWVTGLRNSCRTHPWSDAASLISAVLFEIYPIPVGMMELRRASVDQVQRLLNLSDAALPRFMQLLATCDSRDKLSHKIQEEDGELMQALAQISDEQTARFAHAQALKLFDQLLENVGGRPPQLWHIASRKLPAWSTTRSQQHVHQLITLTIEAALEMAVQCSRQSDAQSDDEQPFEPADLHLLHLLFPLLHSTLRALRSASLSYWRKRLAWDVALYCAKKLAVALAEPPMEPPASDLNTAREAMQPRLASQQRIFLLRDRAARMEGKEGKAMVAFVCPSQPSTAQLQQQLPNGVSSSAQAAFSFDDLSHTVLPWAVPEPDQLDNGDSGEVRGAVSHAGRGTINGNADESIRTISFGRYRAGQELVVLQDGTWSDMWVLQPPEDSHSTIHRVQEEGGAQHIVHLNPWNHAPRYTKVASFTAVGSRYSKSLALQHSHIIDTISRNSLAIFDECVSLEMVPSIPDVESFGSESVDSLQLYEWLRAAHASRCKIPSTLSRFQRMVSQGVPDENAARLSQEMSDLAVELPKSQKVGAEPLHAASKALVAVRNHHHSRTDEQLAEQRTELEDFIAAERQREEDLKHEQQSESEALSEKHEHELEVLGLEHRRETKDAETDHQRRRVEMSARHAATKRQQDQASDMELKNFKEMQYRDLDKQKKKLHAHRIDEEKRFSQEFRSESEQLKQSWQREQSELDAAQSAELVALEEAHATQTNACGGKHASDLESLEALQNEQRAEFETGQQEEATAFAAGQDEKARALLEQYKGLEKDLTIKQEESRKQLVAEQKLDKQALADSQVEERKKLMASQKDDVKRGKEDGERRKTELAAKQEADRREEFKRRNKEKEEKEKKAGDKGKQQPKEQQTEKPPEAKKIPPQKERDMLDALLQEEREKLAVRHERDASALVEKQSEKVKQHAADCEAAIQQLQQDHELAKRQLLEKKEADKTALDQEAKDAQARFEQHTIKEKEKHDLMLLKEREHLGSQKESSLIELTRKFDESKKKLRASHQAQQERMTRGQDEARVKLNTHHDQQRKSLQSSQEEELGTFITAQEDARKKLMQKHKSIEKQLEESQHAERAELEAMVTEEMDVLNAKHDVPRKEAIVRYGVAQAEMDTSHQAARKDLTNELQEQRSEFLKRQQKDREDLASAFRFRTMQIVEQAQNEFNRALIGKACVLLTGPPASGKSVSLSQVLMHCLGDAEGQMIPVLIRVQRLHQLLARERAEIAAVKAAHEKVRGPAEAAQKLERDKASPDQLALTEERHVKEAKALHAAQQKSLKEVHERSAFANSWNWVDGYLRCVHGATSSTYAMLRQALLSRRALILLDGIDEGGAAREAIETHITEVLAPQGHPMLVTARPEGLNERRFCEHFELLRLQPMSDAQQHELIDLRLRNAPGSERAQGESEKLHTYVRMQVPEDPVTGVRETGSPLMLSMIIAVFQRHGTDSTPSSKAALYAKAADIMLERVSSLDTVEPLAHITELLEAIFFRSHAGHRLLIEDQHIEAAALELGDPGQLASLDWPAYKGRIRLGHVVKFIRSEHAGKQGVLSADSRGKLINGREPRCPFKVTFGDKTISGWVKERDILSSGLDQAAFESKVGQEAQRRAMRSAFERMPPSVHNAVDAVKSWVVQNRLPLMALVQSEPLQMQASHLSFQEFFCARAICKGMYLPGEPPWRWSSWWANTLRLGAELGSSFGFGLARGARVTGKLDLVGQLGGHRPTALAAVGALLHGVTSIDLSENSITPGELETLARSIRCSATLEGLNLAKNAIGNQGAVIMSAVLPESKLTMLNLFGTGIKEEGSRALVSAISTSPCLTHLNMQYNAVRGEAKKALEAANAARSSPVFLVL